ncbi:MAG: fumarylacetoacetate hydrolase family protein [Candidatus Nanopelagicales bacterium]
MRIARFSLNDTMAFGVVEGDGLTEPQSVRPLRGHPFGDLEVLDGSVPLAGLRMLPPVLPSKIVAIGKNYADHVAEFDAVTPSEPLMFLKPNTAVVGPGATIRLPEQSQRVDFEAELAVVFGRLCRDVAAEDAADVILGYTCANDVTARDLQARDGQWTRAKGFDTFCPLGPWIETDAPGPDAVVQCTVNGEVRQSAPISDMIYGIGALIAHVTSVMTMLPGDVLLTGTPAGVGPLSDGDHVKVTIDGIGSLDNEVALS